MGMCASLHRASAEDAAWIREHPRDVMYEFFAYDRPQPRAGGIIGFLKRLSPITITETAPEPEPSANGDTSSGPRAHDEVDLDKAWHGLHFLFTGASDGDDEPACYLLTGGEDVGEDEWGDPVARMLSPDKVRSFGGFLNGFDRESLTARFDPARMTELEIYPDAIWERDKRDDALGYLLENFEALRAFVARAADSGDSVVVHVA